MTNAPFPAPSPLFPNPLNNFSYAEEPPPNKTKTKQMSPFVAHSDYSSTANCHTNIPAIFRGTSGIFRGTSEFSVMYSMNIHGILGGKHRTNVT